MFAGLPVSHRGGSGGTFGPWEVVDVTSGTGATMNLPAYQPGDLVYVAAFGVNTQQNSAPGYPSAPGATGFTQFDTTTGAWQTGSTGFFIYWRARVTDLGRIMEAGDTISSISLAGGIRRWCSVALRNAITAIAYTAGPTNITSNSISRNISPADKRLVLGFAGANLTNTPTFTPVGAPLVAESGNHLRLFDDPVPASVGINWTNQAGKIIRQIDFT